MKLQYFIVLGIATALPAVLVANIKPKKTITFGNPRQSAFVVDDTSSFYNNTPGLLWGGSLVNTGLGLVTGNDIRFTRGSYTFFNSTSDIDAVLQLNSNTITLGNNPFSDGDTMIANPGGLQGVSILVKPGLNILRGQPLFFGQNDVVFQDSTSLLGIGIQNTLNTNITLNGGTLFLQDDLRLGDDSVILDSGIVYFNDRRLSLGGKATDWNGNMLWYSALDLQLNSAITLNGVWSFLGPKGQINGNGNIIDLAHGGSIMVLPGSTLTLASVHIKGIGNGDNTTGDGGGRGAIKLANDATLILTDCVIEMESDYVIDSGTIYVAGSSTIITKNNILTFAKNLEQGTHGNLTVDRVALTYDTLASFDRQNIQPTLIQDPNREHITIIGNGEIRTYRSDSLTFHNYQTSSLLQKYSIVAPYRKFQIFPTVQDDASLLYDVPIDGNSNFMGFTYPTGEPTFIVSDNVHAITKNIILRDLSPTHIGLGSNSSLTFGNTTTISISRSETLTYPWVFEGNTVFRGAGNIFELGEGGQIVLQGKNSTLLLDGITLKGIKGSNIICTDPSNTIILKNVKWVQSGDFTFSTGNLTMLDDVTMPAAYNFIYASNGLLKLLSNMTWLLTRGAQFTYNPASGASNLFVMTDSTSALMLDSGVINAPTPLTLSNGLFIVRNSNAQSGIINFAGSLTRDWPPGATLASLN
jgi:hypothetical protein